MAALAISSIPTLICLQTPLSATLQLLGSFAWSRNVFFIFLLSLHEVNLESCQRLRTSQAAAEALLPLSENPRLNWFSLVSLIGSALWLVFVAFVLVLDF